MDCLEKYMRALGLPLTLETYVALNWVGDRTVADVLNEAELAAELPVELLKDFLKHGDCTGISVETLAWIAEVIEEEEE